MDNPATAPKDSSGYTVVARRYRPRSFSELVGQDHIAHALDAAIATGRVGHAYLFTGARGVGKTSSARIFAKALNASDGVEQELAADMARSIDSGDDMDVIEIDGASNRGIEEIRTLRANVNVHNTERQRQQKIEAALRSAVSGAARNLDGGIEDIYSAR